MKDMKSRRARMAPFRKSSFWVDLAITVVAITAAIGFSLVISDLIWGPVAVTEWLASLFV